jgi:hypothetical protein
MRYFRLAGLCLISVLAMGMALAGNAFATPLWLLCSEGKNTNNTKYEEAACAVAKSGGAWESVALPSGQSETLVIKGLTLTLTDLKAGKERSTIKCDGVGSEGTERITPPNKGVITSFVVKEPSKNCERVEEPCKAGEVEEVKGADLPWKTEIFETEKKFLTKIVKGEGAAGEPGWSVTCKTTLGSETDKCTSENEAKAEQELLENVNSVRDFRFLILSLPEHVHKYNCTQSESKETGEMSGYLAVLGAPRSVSINST